MSKKQTKNKQNAKNSGSVNDSLLPQNILSIGDCAHEDKCIYISQPAYKEIHNFSRDKTKKESGGVLMGKAIEAFGKTHILISGFIQARYSIGTPTNLTFTHESWDYIYREVARYPGQKIIGWIHTHPSFGVFLSENDKFVQKTAFSGENQIAYVIDPINKSEGFFYWKNGAMEQSKGFYMYDRTGVKIAQRESDAKEPLENSKEQAGFLGVIVAMLLVACITLGYVVFKLNRRVISLERRISPIERKIDDFDKVTNLIPNIFK